jgi:hypothetical protein
MENSGRLISEASFSVVYGIPKAAVVAQIGESFRATGPERNRKLFAAGRMLAG